MASILRQIVASPRARHPEAGLDLCYVTDQIIATSGPSGTYPQVAYRNPLKDLVKFLDGKHGSEWAIWEFRAEGTGYPDEEVYGRVHHYPWPDHHPPPFALIPLIMASMRNWLKEEVNGGTKDGRVVVVHCKAGKGRSGTISCSYLISEEGWNPEVALQRFTERRMRPGFGNGVSIPSQRRWISYVDRWAKGGKKYVERPVEITEIHVWGLRDGVKLAVEGYVEEGKVIKKFHTFHSSEREMVRGKIRSDTGFADAALELMGQKKANTGKPGRPQADKALNDAEASMESSLDSEELVGGDVIFRPSSRLVLPSSDVNLDVERRNKSRYGGFTMVTSVGHVWFNTFFEGKGPEQNGVADDSGVFEIEWDAMDGIRGSSRKGTRAFDKISVVWKTVDMGPKTNVAINEPATGEAVDETAPADWRGQENNSLPVPKIGLRPESTDSEDVSRASSMGSKPHSYRAHGSEEELTKVRQWGPQGEAEVKAEDNTSANDRNKDEAGKTHVGALPDAPITERPGQLDGAITNTDDLPKITTSELPEGKPEDEMKDHKDHSLGHVKLGNTETSS